MSRFFVGNFSFEQGGATNGTVPRQIVRFEAEIACLWMAMAVPGDVIFSEFSFDDKYWETLERLGIPRIATVKRSEVRSLAGAEIVPWGWTPGIRRLAQQSLLTSHSPDQETVWRVNSRKFQVELCSDLNLLLPGEHVIDSWASLESCLNTVGDESGWILKPNFGQAGRGHLRGQGKRLSQQQQSAIRNLLARQSLITFEPALTPILELGGQWEIPSTGTPELLGLSQLLTDSRGAYRGSGTKDVEIAPEARDTIVRAQLQAALRLQQAGYFGPAGIDAMIHRIGEQVAVRPIQDINARFTMGRIGLEWGLRMHASPLRRRDGFWLHAKVRPDSNAICLSPKVLGGEPVQHLTWWKPES
jgi:hypothetical protein